MVQITIIFDGSWVLGIKNVEALPNQLVAAKAEDTSGVQVKKSGFTEVLLLVDEAACEIGNFTDQLMELVGKAYGLKLDQLKKVMTIRAERTEEKFREKPDEKTAPTETRERKTEKKQTGVDAILAALGGGNADQEEGEAEEPAIEQILKLRESEEFIKVCRELHRMAPLARKRGVEDVLSNQTYLFSIDPGYGLSTDLHLLAALLGEDQIFGADPQPVEIRVPRIDDLGDLMQTLGRVENRLLSLDISEWLDALEEPTFRAFLLFLRECQDSLVLAFRVPYLEQSELDKIAQFLADIFTVRTISCPPLSLETLEAYAEEMVEEGGFRLDDQARELFDIRVSEEKADGKFYGIKTVQKIACEMIYDKLRAVTENISVEDDSDQPQNPGAEAATDKDTAAAEAEKEVKPEDIITAEDLAGFTRVKGEIRTPDEELAALVGMNDVVRQLQDIVMQIEYARKNRDIDAPTMHMRFVGNPGTGKTTVARILGRMLRARGILSKGYFFERAGGDFIGKYVGHTAPKTAAICRDAYGSVLFIDEAYALASSNYNGGDNGYSKEAIDALIAQMENHRSNMVVIMAGYEKDMTKLMALNQGLSGRMPYEIRFPNFSREDLARIFFSMADQNRFTLEEGVKEAVETYFRELPEATINAADFSNARYVRNLFEKTWSKTVVRTQLNKGDSRTISLQDFILASGDNQGVLNDKKPERRRIGF